MADTEHGRARSASAWTAPQAVPEPVPEAAVPEEVARLAAVRGSAAWSTSGAASPPGAR